MSTNAEVARAGARWVETLRGDGREQESACPTEPPDLDIVIEQAPCAVVLLGAGGDIVFANRRLTGLFGIEPTAALGHPIETLIPDAAGIMPLLDRLTDCRTSRFQPSPHTRLMVTGRRGDGSRFPVELHLSSIRHGGRAWVLSVLQDATEQCRMLEEVRQAKCAAEALARTKGEFLALAAHDLTQPLQALELTIDSMARNGGAAEEGRPWVAAARTSVARMRELLKMLLEISRIESGTVTVDEEPVRIAEVFESLQRQHGAAAGGRGLALFCDPSPHLVRTDARLLRGMLDNLVGNAIRYTPSGEIRLRVREGADGSLHLEVSDTGVGIPDTETERIFEDFHRLDEARRLTREGCGLGLGIVRRLSKLLGLPVTVESVVGRGSTFTIGIPEFKVLHVP